jgi:hypothetical protein
LASSGIKATGEPYLEFVSRLATAHRLGERDVFLRETVRIVGRERHLDGTVDIEPLGMVVHFFGDERRARHEAERLIEVLEGEFPRDRVASVDLTPLREACECGLARRAFEFCHRSLLLPFARE